MTATQPLAEPFGLGVEPGLVGHTLAENSLDDEVNGAESGQQVAGDRQIGCFREQFA